jgi:hypothetical protein
MRLRYSVALFLISISFQAFAVEYHCDVEDKVTFDKENPRYSEEAIKKWKFSVKVLDSGKSAVLKRCGYSSQSKEVTCDPYKVDYVTSSPLWSFKAEEYLQIKKYYVFSGQFDVQIYPDMSFIENNGRGVFAQGVCKVVSP